MNDHRFKNISIRAYKSITNFHSLANFLPLVHRLVLFFPNLTTFTTNSLGYINLDCSTIQRLLISIILLKYLNPSDEFKSSLVYVNQTVNLCNFCSSFHPYENTLYGHKFDLSPTTVFPRNLYLLYKMRQDFLDTHIPIICTECPRVHFLKPGSGPRANTKIQNSSRILLFLVIYIKK